MKISLPMVTAGAIITWLGRHSVLGVTIGCGLMFAGWVIIEFAELKQE